MRAWVVAARIGRTQGAECLDLLELLDGRGHLRLPAKRPGKPPGTRTRVPVTAQGDPQAEWVINGGPSRGRTDNGTIHATSIVLEHKTIQLGNRRGAPCPSRSGAIKAPCDADIGWDEATRRRNLPRVVNNSRFLLLPWVRVANLASRVLSLAARRLADDCAERYAVEPLLVETLVDPQRYTGHCDVLQRRSSFISATHRSPRCSSQVKKRLRPSVASALVPGAPWRPRKSVTALSGPPPAGTA